MVVIACVASACLGQTVQDKDAKILKEQRFNAGDGRSGAAFATENGQIFREETDINGNRIGQYSYIGDDGQTYTVKYSAGIDGFKILEGEHIQATGQESAPFDPKIAGEDRAPLPAAAPAPLRQEVQESDPNRNPFINPHDPTHRDFAFNTNGAQFQPPTPAGQPARAPQQGGPVTLDASFVPNCAGCAGINLFVNPFDESHGGQQVAFVPAQQPARRPAQPFIPRPVAPVQPAQDVPIQDFNGQIQINRFETGFNFDFQA